jgi:NADPH2:quinone reductase
MKAIRVREFGGPEVLMLEQIPDLKPDAGRVLVRIHAVGVNPVDTYIRAGAYTVKPNLPYTPGADAAGIIEAIGQGVSRVKVGDRVYTAGTATGSYAEMALCSESQVHALPSQLSFAQGAAIHTPYATAFRALFQRARALPGETVFVHGASGGVGVAAVQLARAAGLKVIGTAGTEKGRVLVKDQGAHDVLDHRSPDYLKELMALTDGKGVDIILEMLANVNLGKDLSLLAMEGRVVVIGNRGTVEINARDTMSRNAAILGMALQTVPERDRASIHAALGAGLGNGTLRPVVGQEMPLAEAARAHKAVLEPGAYGKIVLIP